MEVSVGSIRSLTFGIPEHAVILLVRRSWLPVDSLRKGVLGDGGCQCGHDSPFEKLLLVKEQRPWEVRVGWQMR